MPFFNSKTDKLKFALLTNNGLTNVRLNKIATEYEDFYDGLKDDFQLINDKKFTEKVINFKKSADKEVQNLYNIIEENRIRFITVFDKQYPGVLRKLKEPPMVLFFQGNPALFSKLDKMITVVGSRDTTKYTIAAMQKILSPLCNSGVGVVSGMASGVDFLSHNIALENKAPTIAVLGSGLLNDVISPKEHIQIKQRILENEGLVMSELLPFQESNKYTFPRRNRILAALTELTFVFQAGHKSGSMITAQYAIDFGKKIATIPVSLDEDVYSGNLELLSNKEAICATKAEDISSEIGVKLSQKKVKNIYKDLSPDETILIDQLRGGEQSVDVLASQIPLSKLMVLLSTLEMQGLVKNTGANNWRLT